MPRIEAIIFDKDGTLFDFRATWGVWAMALLDRLAGGDRVLFQDAGAAIGFDPDAGGFHPSSIVIAGTAWQVADALAPVVGRDRAEVIAIGDRIAAETEPVPAVDLLACLGELGRGRPLGLVTNDSEVPARAHLDRSGITEHFVFIAGYDSGHGAKPEPGPLLAFAGATGVDPAATLMVGDSTHDLIAGTRAGMIPVGVLTGVAGEETLAPHAEVVLRDIGELAAWIAARDARA